MNEEASRSDGETCGGVVEVRGEEGKRGGRQAKDEDEEEKEKKEEDERLTW